MNNSCICLVFHAHINEMYGSRRKISSKNFVRQRCAEGFNTGVKGLMYKLFLETPVIKLWKILIFTHSMEQSLS
jgi:hypothetical protein